MMLNRDGAMRLFHAAICAALIVMTPLAAHARWHTYRGWRHHVGRSRSFGRLPRDRSDAWRLAEPRGASCGIGQSDSSGRLRRCAAARAAFERDNPCPSTGEPRGARPGYVVDHIVPLKRGGADDPTNMQWQRLPRPRRRTGLNSRAVTPARHLPLASESPSRPKRRAAST